MQLQILPFVVVIMARLVHSQAPDDNAVPAPQPGCAVPMTPIIQSTDVLPAKVHVHFYLGDSFPEDVIECSAETTIYNNKTESYELVSRTAEYRARTRIDVADLFNGETYCFTVDCRNDCGVSGKSNQLCDEPWDVPKTPSVLELAVFGTNVRIKYEVPDDTNRDMVDHYMIDAQDVATGGLVTIQQRHWPANTTEEKIQGFGEHEFNHKLYAGTWDFSVRAYNKWGSSKRSNTLQTVVESNSKLNETIVGLAVAVAILGACIVAYCYYRCRRTRIKNVIQDDHIELESQTRS